MRSRTLGRSAKLAAVLIGATVGCILAFAFHLNPYSIFARSSSSTIINSDNAQVALAECVTSEQMNLLKTESLLMRARNMKLQKQIDALNEKLRLAHQGNGEDMKRVSVLNERPKAGPFGTVKAIRTSPTIPPD